MTTMQHVRQMENATQAALAGMPFVKTRKPRTVRFIEVGITFDDNGFPTFTVEVAFSRGKAEPLGIFDDLNEARREAMLAAEHYGVSVLDFED
jgi:hypothetical protein